MPNWRPLVRTVRVVADTNTVLSAFWWGGHPGDVLNAARHGQIVLLTSAVLITELEDVLAREKFAERIARVGSSVNELLAGYRALVTLARPAAVEAITRDPDDDHVIACAVGANAEIIVTRNRDLLDLGSFQNIRILAARDALEAIAPR